MTQKKDRFFSHATIEQNVGLWKDVIFISVKAASAATHK